MLPESGGNEIKERGKEMKAKLGMVILMGVFMAAFAHAAVVEINNTFTGLSSINGWYSLQGADGPKYQNGAGARWDYWDGDDGVAQPAADASEAVAIVAAGGTITGDGMLADGALWFDVHDGEKGNEYIAFNLGGTMEEGETVTFSYDVYNDSDYYSYTQGQLWDMTTTNQLAVPEPTPEQANGWTIMLARSATNYHPHGWSVSYTATAAEEGHVLAIVFREWANSNKRDPYIDSINVTSSVAHPEDLYNAWALSEGLTSSNNAYAQNPDGDELDNLAEYGLGGQPTNAANQGIASVYGTMEEGGTNWMTYIYAMRSDYSLRGLGYYLETSADLVATSWTNGNYEVVGIHETGGDFNYVTNRVSTDVETEQFLRVGIELTP